jgi:hypothetical protein
MELLSQLGTGGANEAFAAVHAFPRVHDPKASGMLPWSDDLFRISIFGTPPGKDVMTPALNAAVQNVLSADEPKDLFEEGTEMRELLVASLEEPTKQLSDLLEQWRRTGPLEEAEHRLIFARSIARRAGFDEDKVDVDAVLGALNAYYQFGKRKISVGADQLQYNVLKHKNDEFDAELLIYLADPTLHLLTSDGGFNRAKDSSQASRVHIVPADCLKDAKCAEQAIRNIVGD